jgi:hypothetical protein
MIELSTLAFDVAWRDVVGGQHHVALRCDSPGRTWAERAEHVARARTELAGVDLSLLRLFDRPERELYGWYRTGTEPNTVLAVAHGRRGAVARRRGDRVTLRSCRPDDLPAAVAGALPATTPLSVSLTVPLPRETDEFADPLCRDELPELLSAPRSGAGEFHAAHRDHLGRRVRTEFPVGYADTADGRFVTTLGRGADGTIWLSMLSAHLLETRLAELVHSN